MTNLKRFNDLSQDCRHVFYMYANDSATICENCANESTSLDTDIFGEVSRHVHYEGDSLICDGCNTEIESAYGVPDND